MHVDVGLFKDKLRGAYSQLPHLPRALAIVWTAAGGWMIAWLVLLVVQGLLPVLTVFLTRTLVDGLVGILGDGASWSAVRPILLLVAVMAGLLLVTELLRIVTSYVRTVQGQLVEDHLQHLVHDQSIAVDLSFYDRPDFYDRLHRARYYASDRPLRLVESLGSVLQGSLTLLAMACVLIPFGIGIPLALLASSLPALYVALQQRLRLHQWHVQSTATQRRALYCDWLLTARESAAELRLFDMGGHFQALYQSLRQRLRRERCACARDECVADAIAALLALAVTGATSTWMVWRLIQGAITLGDLALFYQAFNQGQRLMRSLLDSAGEIYSNLLFLGDLNEFLELEPKVKSPARAIPVPTSLSDGVRFQRVTFRYPGNPKPALVDFNLHIHAGQITAIVGVNGAGKSTLVRLLCRLHDPDQGSILLDGVDLRRFQVEALRGQITVLFQEPVRYNNTVSENIALGDLIRQPDRAAIQAAARAAGADRPIGGLPHGYDTLLGKWFDEGADLSAGEWQRIALARAYWRQAPIIILDEPTSAMDPWAEHDWLVRFRELARGRTALIITHRFTTAKFADIVHVMDRGQVVESGSHDDLLQQNGLYAQSWHRQMDEPFSERVSKPAPVLSWSNSRC